MTPNAAIALITDIDHVFEFGKLLDQGTQAVIDVVIGLSDDALTNAIPALATAKQACGVVPGCLDEYKQLELTLGREFFRQTGLWGLVSRLVNEWHRIPGALRLGIKTLQSFAGRAKDVLDIGLALLDNPTKFIMDAQAAGEDWLVAHSLGVIPLLTKEADKLKAMVTAIIPGAKLLSALSDAVDDFLESLGPVGGLVSGALHFFGL